MKPLTIEELKALEVGDWVWVISRLTNKGTYRQVYEITEESFICDNGDWYQNFCNYPLGWLVYKNKEQAEAKGEILELPCKVGDKVCIFEKRRNEIIVNEYIVKKIQWENGETFLTLSPAMKICIDEWLIGDLTKDYLDLQSIYICTKEQAQARLQELRGEK